MRNPGSNLPGVVLLISLAFSAAEATTLYKWVDQNGTVHFGDRPQHANSQGIKLPRHTPARSSSRPSGHDQASSRQRAASNAENSTPTSAEGKKAEEYYCNQASETYDSYSKAPRLYKTNAEGQREYLSDKEAAALLAETKAKVTEWCT